MAFKKATKEQAKLRLAFDGTSGSGKTFCSLTVAKILGAKTALIDSERGSASKYADIFDFDKEELQDYSPLAYIAAIEAAGKAGYGTLIIDSLSHAWAGKGGLLELVDRYEEKVKFTKGWRHATPIHNRLVDTMLAFPGHLICTMRQKTEWVVEKDAASGKSVPRKVGLAPVQRDGMEYEFDVFADLDVDGNLYISKSRCLTLPYGPDVFYKRSDLPEITEKLKAWLSSGVPRSTPAPAPAVQASTPAPAADFDVNATPAPEAAAADHPPTPEESEKRLAALLEAATCKADFERLAPELKAQPEPVRDRLRPIWNRRFSAVVTKAVVTKKGGAHAVNG